MKNRTKRLLLAGVITCSMLVGCLGEIANAAESDLFVTKAANVKEIPSTELESVYELPVDSNLLEEWAEGPQIYSEAGIVMDIDSGAILYAKNIDDRHYPASITKIMTALVVFQNYEMDETVSFTWDDVGFLEYGDAHIGIKPDEEVGMEDCLYGMLLASANEVSHALGAHMEGGYEEFLKVMNETSAELGCENSHWMNTHGLHDEQHYTCCRDMALIGSELFQYEKFREITSTYQHTIPETNITDETRTFQQNHDMINQWSNRYYEYCVGGKTGYTDQALTTLVTFATKDDMNLVAVVMRTHGGGGNAYVDTREMLDYAFDNFSKVAVSTEDIECEDIAEIGEESYVIVPKGLSVEKLEYVFEEPAEVGDKTGEITYLYHGQPVGSMEATITEEYYNEVHGIEETKEEEKQDSEDKSKIPGVIKIIVVIILILFIGFLILLQYIKYKKRLMRKRRHKRRRSQRKNRRYE